MAELYIPSFAGTRLRPAPAGGGGGGGGTVLLSSDWATALGQSNAAILDTDKPSGWEYLGHGGGPENNRLEVISSSGLGFPASMTNVLRSLLPAGTQNYTQIQRDWTPIAVGETLYYRVYFRQAMADSEGSLSHAGNHTIESCNGGGAFGSDGGWTFAWGNNADGTFLLQWRFNVYGNAHVIGFGTETEGSPTYLDKNKTYRIEWSIERVGTSLAEFHGRVYDEAVSTTVPVFDDTNMSGYDYDGGNHRGTIASGYGTNLPLQNNSFGTVELGPNGVGWTLAANQYAYYGGMRMVLGGSWIGPYVLGEE